MEKFKQLNTLYNSLTELEEKMAEISPYPWAGFGEAFEQMTRGKNPILDFEQLNKVEKLFCELYQELPELLYHLQVGAKKNIKELIK